jgi:hypothetical protein
MRKSAKPGQQHLATLDSGVEVGQVPTGKVVREIRGREKDAVFVEPHDRSIPRYAMRSYPPKASVDAR